MKIMKIVLVFIVALMVGCGPLFNNESLNPEDLPLKLAVSSSTVHFTATPITFTGDPKADFGVPRQFLDDYDDQRDAINPILYPSSQDQMDIQEIYVAYDTNYLYIAHQCTNDLVTGSSAPGFMGGMMIVIDNGLTNGNGSNGVTNVDAAGYADAGLSGDLGFDNLGIGVEDGYGKISFCIKHWRVQNQVSTAVYGFTDNRGGTLKTLTSLCSYYEPDKLATGVTEIAIPWTVVFGSSYVVPGTYVTPPAKKVKLFFLTDPTLDLTGGRDVYPAHSTTMMSVNTVSNWLEIQIAD